MCLLDVFELFQMFSAFFIFVKNKRMFGASGKPVHYVGHNPVDEKMNVTDLPYAGSSVTDEDNWPVWQYDESKSSSEDEQSKRGESWYSAPKNPKPDKESKKRILGFKSAFGDGRQNNMLDYVKRHGLIYTPEGFWVDPPTNPKMDKESEHYWNSVNTGKRPREEEEVIRSRTKKNDLVVETGAAERPTVYSVRTVDGKNGREIYTEVLSEVPQGAKVQRVFLKGKEFIRVLPTEDEKEKRVDEERHTVVQEQEKSEIPSVATAKRWIELIGEAKNALLVAETKISEAMKSLF